MQSLGPADVTIPHGGWFPLRPLSDVGRAGATSLPTFKEESRDRKPGLATNPERIGSAFDTMSSAKGRF